jgi:hypothetical protein
MTATARPRIRAVFSAGPVVALADVVPTRYYRVEWLECWSSELSLDPCMGATAARELVARLDARGCHYRIFAIATK